MKELVKKFKPHILWNDLGWPKLTKDRLYTVFADFFNADSERLVNDRWGLPKKENLWRGDFLTPEYTLIDTVQEIPFEMNRGLGQSFIFFVNFKKDFFLFYLEQRRFVLVLFEKKNV